MQYKESASGETLTVKLQNNSRNDNKRLSLAGLGKHDAWKLYRVDTGRRDPTGLRMLLAYELWNKVAGDESLVVPCRFAELIENGEYSGLCILRPRTDDDYFRAAGALSVRDVSDEEPDPLLYTDMSSGILDLPEYFLWLQLIYMPRGLYEDLRILSTGEGDYLLPGKPEFVFGLLPADEAYRAFHYDELMLEETDLQLSDSDTLALSDAVRDRWLTAREDYWSDAAIDSALDILYAELSESGAAIRVDVSEQAIVSLRSQLHARNATLEARYGQ